MFKREKRYFVFKKTDVPPDTAPQLGFCEVILDAARSLRGKQPLQTLVIESDWPEYEPAWEEIQRRMEGRQSLVSELQEKIEKLKDDLTYVNLQPCPQCTAAEAEVQRLTDQNLRILRREFTQICSYCGHEFPAEGAYGWEDLQAHIQVCPQHPVGKLQAELHYAKEALAQLAGFGNGDQLGNNESNVVAQQALVKLDDMRKAAEPVPLDDRVEGDNISKSEVAESFPVIDSTCGNDTCGHYDVFQRYNCKAHPKPSLEACKNFAKPGDWPF